MSTHTYHERDELTQRPILCDGCPRCEEQAEELGIHLDSEKWQRMWKVMLGVEFNDAGPYQSHAEKKLGVQMYHMALILQRNTMVDPERLLGA